MDKFVVFVFYTVVIATFSSQVSAFYCEDECDDDEYCCGYNICCDTFYWYQAWYIWFSSVLAVIVLISLCSICCCRRRYQRQHIIVHERPVTVVHTYDGTQPILPTSASPVYQTDGYGKANHGYQTGYGSTMAPQQVTTAPPGYAPAYAPAYPTK